MAFFTPIRVICLNPYCNGTCSRRYVLQLVGVMCLTNVLILIVMEHALGVVDACYEMIIKLVLILIVMEHALGDI